MEEENLRTPGGKGGKEESFDALQSKAEPQRDAQAQGACVPKKQHSRDFIYNYLFHVFISRILI